MGFGSGVRTVMDGQSIGDAIVGALWLGGIAIGIAGIGVGLLLAWLF